MEKIIKEITLEVLEKIIQSQEGEFIIHVELGEGEKKGDGRKK